MVQHRQIQIDQDQNALLCLARVAGIAGLVGYKTQRQQTINGGDEQLLIVTEKRKPGDSKKTTHASTAVPKSNSKPAGGIKSAPSETHSRPYPHRYTLELARATSS